jgi:hypothetical protein
VARLRKFLEGEVIGKPDGQERMNHKMKEGHDKCQVIQISNLSFLCIHG